MSSRFVRKRITSRTRRHRRVRARVRGTIERPRLSVFRSNKHIIIAQLINDDTGMTLVAATSRDSEISNQQPGVDTNRNVAVAHAVGKLIAERAHTKGITAVVFDRSGYAYHGMVRAIAEGAREGGLEL